MCAFNIKQSEMARLTKRSAKIYSKYKRKYKKKASYKKKKTYKSSSKGYKSNSLTKMARKISANHYLSYGVSSIRKRPTDVTLMKSLKGSSRSVANFAYGAVSAATAGFQSATTVCGVYTPYDVGIYLAQPSTFLLSRHFMESCRLTITLTNQSNVPTFVDLYDIAPRSDLSNSSAYQSPTEAWLAGAGAAATPVYYGAQPFTEQFFVESFKILRVTRINMSAGETAEHRCTYNANQIFKRENSSFGLSATQDQGAYQNLTHFVMMVTRGAPGDADDTTVGSMPTKIDYIVQKQYSWKVVPDGTPTQTFFNTALPTSATKIMELDGDETTFQSA